MDFAEIDQCKPVLLGLSLAGNLVKALLFLFGTEWREPGYTESGNLEKPLISLHVAEWWERGSGSSLCTL